MKSIFMCLTVLGMVPSHATTLERVGIPFGAPTTETPLPFGLYGEGLESMRYQQVYGADGFTFFVNQPVLIYSVNFALGPTIGNNSDQPNFQVNLSVTQNGPDNLSTVFSENIGINETVVFGPSSISWPNVGPDESTWKFQIPLGTPYYYDPSQGNLLMDIRNFEPEEFFQPEDLIDPLPAIANPGDPVSRVYANSVDALVGEVDTLGINTLFLVEQVPEPSTISLGILGLVGFCFFLRHKGATRS